MRDTSQYVVEGRRVPSVTEVLRLVGLDDWSHVPPDTLAAAQERGQLVHYWCEMVDRYDVAAEEADPEAVPYVTAYRSFRGESRWEVELIEHPLVSARLRLAGTPDRVFRVPGEPIPRLVDLKSGEPTDAAKMQTAGYAELLMDAGTYPRLRRHTLALRADGAYRLSPEYRDPADRLDFLAALRVTHRILAANPGRIT